MSRPWLLPSILGMMLPALQCCHGDTAKHYPIERYDSMRLAYYRPSQHQQTDPVGGAFPRAVDYDVAAGSPSMTWSHWMCYPHCQCYAGHASHGFWIQGGSKLPRSILKKITSLKVFEKERKGIHRSKEADMCKAKRSYHGTLSATWTNPIPSCVAWIEIECPQHSSGECSSKMHLNIPEKWAQEQSLFTRSLPGVYLLDRN